MAPAGRTEDVLPFLLPADIIPDQILADGLPFVENDVHGAGIFQGFGKTKFDGFVFRFRQFGLKSAE